MKLWIERKTEFTIRYIISTDHSRNFDSSKSLLLVSVSGFKAFRSLLEIYKVINFNNFIKIYSELN